MRKEQEIKIVVHKPEPENNKMFEAVLSEELVKLIEVLLAPP